MPFWSGLLQNLRGTGEGRAPSEVHSATQTQTEIDFRALAESSADVICRLGPNLRFRYLSPSAERLFGMPTAEIMRRTPEEFILQEDLPVIAASAARSATGDGEQEVAVRIRRGDGSVRWVEAQARILRDEQKRTGDFILVMRDITDRKEMEQRLAFLAHTDGLTGLANRRAFDEALERDWQHTRRSAGQLSLLLIDVDHFKAYNDCYGHQAGDDCLRSVSTAVQRTAQGPGNMIARYGGEELAVILPGSDAQHAAVVAEQIRAAVQSLAILHEGNPEGGSLVTISVGAATTLSRDGGTMNSFEGLLLAADEALYKAKRNGRNLVESTVVLAPAEGSANLG